MSFSKTPLHVFPYSVPLAPGDIEPIPIDPQFPITGTPTATLIDSGTGIAVTPAPAVSLGDTITGSGAYPEDRPEVICTVTGPPVGLYALRVTFVGQTGRIWSILLAIPSSDR
jgi:hypothetical protein